jgi:hypothetical protein
MRFREMFPYLYGGALLLLPLVGIAYGLLTSFRPQIREPATRILFLGLGALMFLSSLSTLILTSARESILLLLLGAVWIAQGSYWNDRRIRGVLGGTGIIAVGIW